jgi:ribosome-interacting GTPase 1
MGVDNAERAMPANLTPEYKEAEAAFRAAREPRERLECLREMLRAIPKHKGTDHLQADIKGRIKELTDELTAARRGGTRTGPPTVIRPEGAAQIALLGPPNSGKSALHHALAGSHAAVGPYPFTTQYPQPGMLPFEDVAFQLIDLPPATTEHPVPWLANALQPADGAMLVVDLTDPACVEAVLRLHGLLAARRVQLIPSWPRGLPPSGDDESDPFAIVLPTLLVAAKADLVADREGELAVFRELTGVAYPALTVSALTGEGLEDVGPWLFDRLGVVRVYTKVPHCPADLSRPYTVRRGQTVHDVAVMVHKEVAGSLRHARLWNRGGGGGAAGGPGPPGRRR